MPIFNFYNREIEYEMRGSTCVFEKLDISFIGQHTKNGYLENLTGLKFPSGLVHIKGSFVCNHNGLKSLFGLPRGMVIDKNFICVGNELMNLGGLPEDIQIGGNFYCWNNNLQNLFDVTRFLPKSVLKNRNITREIPVQ